MKTIGITCYSDYPGFGWSAYGRFVVNYAYNRATSIFFDGVCIWEVTR